MKKFIVLALLAILSMMFMACGSTEVEYIEEFAHVTNVQAPDTLEPNTNGELKIFFQVRNGCGVFSRFEDSRSGNETTISVYKKYPVDAVCTQAIEIRQAAYKFNTSMVSADSLIVFRVQGVDTVFEKTVFVR